MMVRRIIVQTVQRAYLKLLVRLIKYYHHLLLIFIRVRLESVGLPSVMAGVLRGEFLNELISYI
jgi:hypothetical protein